MRGKVYPHCSAIAFARITPACAGKSLRGSLDAVEVEDHPRVCGEKEGGVMSGGDN